MCYITFIDTMDMFKVWPLLTVTIDLIGQFIIVQGQYTRHVISQTIMFMLSLLYIYAKENFVQSTYPKLHSYM